MTPWLDDGDVRLHHGDALERLREMPSESVQCIVTSPPFWGLRDYGTGRWEGSTDPDCDHLKTPHGRSSSTLRNDGREHTGPYEGEKATRTGTPFTDVCGKCNGRRVDDQIGLEETPDEWCAKLVAVMREARRVLRSDGVCWIEVGDGYHGGGYANHKINGPEWLEAHGGDRRQSRQQDRINANPSLKPKDLVGAPWLLAFALRADGWYLRSDTIWARPNPMPESVTDRPTKAHSYVFLLTKSARYFYDADAIREGWTDERNGASGATRSKYADAGAMRQDGGVTTAPQTAGRNARSVWSIPTEPTPFAHFATFPQALVERCIKSGSAEGDVILDPFMGSGTTALVARRLGRHAIGVELNESYLTIAATRLEQLSLLA